MENHVCPHCRTEVPQGANVCTGCQAEIEYGTPNAAFIAVFLAAALLGGWIGTNVNSTVGWIAFAIILVGGLIGCFKLFTNRVSFKRIYKTR
ncbi:hypothetical protein [Halothiobacillus diazotrophicus]|uniref:hypothetical protein n=1 Tax=Halothiobacillus diazotrophicus TaxID=1860122 RepID=UPI0012E8861D|nr:hypothetical protein [Halothiobacillus diazotrophicus]